MFSFFVAAMALYTAEPAMAQTPSPSPTATATATSAFDGGWAVTLTCAPASDGARRYIFHFAGQVTGGFFHAEHGTANTASWLAIDGPIHADGSATLAAQGLTGAPDYSVGRVAPLTPYSYHVTAHFDARHGTGTRVELRPCELQFDKM